MRIINDKYLKLWGNFEKNKKAAVILLIIPFQFSYAYAERAEKNQFHLFKGGIGSIFSQTPKRSAEKIDITELSKFPFDPSKMGEYAVPAQGAQVLYGNLNKPPAGNLSFLEAIHRAVQRRPEISQSIARVSEQHANIDYAKSKYYPQLSGGINTADLTKGERGGQVFTIDATQVLYDFGKIKSSVLSAEAKTLEEQAGFLVSLDQVSYDVANAIINIKRYQEVTKIAQQQIKGIGKIAEIANLRAKAGISSQADPIQAQSNLEAAEANLIVQETQLRQYQQRLRTLLGYDLSGNQWLIPDAVLQRSDLYADPNYSYIPSIMQAQAAVEVAKSQKQQVKLSVYPSINIKGSLSQAVNGRNPNNNEDDGFYNSIMLEASSNFYQGGGVSAQTRAASYAEQAAQAQVNTAYLDVLDQVRLIREQIESKKRQMAVLVQRRETTARTKELYQEQYKLGTRTVVDLLNAEQSIHSAAMEIVNSQYDIYAGLVQYIQVTGRSRDVYELNNMKIQGVEVNP
ncbi:TolC family protein [Acinetobacter sp. ANC 3813]|uniref:TolC family protein n=1 Tax=Acinetobacter sp. ANC 3813 TaxID=1977873 RepID=UPI000A346071|nr:TolC family protein [Acinetobacter sp. ANC 3813]OTG91579.1 RND transporter [Acinetobacter sp. ANC 3813]